MKKMKKINYFLMFALSLVLFLSCDDDYDNTLPASDEAGVIIDVSKSSGKLLGTPLNSEDLENTEIVFSAADVDLSFLARMNLGNLDNIDKFELVKTFNGGAEVSLLESTTLPFDLEYETVDDYISGFGIAASDLRIGDIFEFAVKVYQNDGDVYYYASTIGKFSVVVNCASNLAGLYDVTTVRDDGASKNHGIEEIVEISPGYYKTVTTGTWAAGAIAPDQGFNFNDTCSSLSLPSQNLAQNYYSNDVIDLGGSTVLPNGNLVINYEIEFSAGNRQYTNTYVKQ